MIIYTCITNNYVDLYCDLPSGASYHVYGIVDPPSPWIGHSIDDLELSLIHI